MVLMVLAISVLEDEEEDEEVDEEVDEDGRGGRGRGGMRLAAFSKSSIKALL